MVVVEARHSATPPLRMPRSALVVVILLALLGAGSFWLLSGGELAALRATGRTGPGPVPQRRLRPRWPASAMRSQSPQPSPATRPSANVPR